MSKKKRKTVRTSFRKNRNPRPRQSDWTQRFKEHGFKDEDPRQDERLSGKGDLTRKRTICGVETKTGDATDLDVTFVVDETVCRTGRVLGMYGLISVVEADDGTIYQCTIRRLLKTLRTDQRHVVATGDRVLFRPTQSSNPPEGLIERIEPRHGSICRASRGRQHVIVTNVDQLLIITSAAEPRLKPNLIDRMLVAAEKAGVRPIICINKIDLTDPASLQPIVGIYSQIGYQVVLVSAKGGGGIDRLRRLLVDRESVVAGQSGVGKSSLLNAVDPGFGLRVRTVSADTQKGRHTTTTARLLPLSCGGYVVDTPGIRQFQLWDVIPEEVAGFYRDLRPYINHCRFPNCTHTHEADCAVKNAVADGHLNERRYDSYCHLILDNEP